MAPVSSLDRAANAPAVMDLLREATWPQHQHAEGRELERDLARGALPRETFVAWLGQRFLMHQALEAGARRLRERDSRVAAIALDELWQVENLRRDLSSLGVAADQIPSAIATARFVADVQATEADAPLGLLGHNYVFEGSKNGARMLARAVAQAYRLEPGPGLLYLDPHGARQRPLWMEYKAAMNAAGFRPDEQAAIVQAARRTFDFVSAVDDELYSGEAARL